MYIFFKYILSNWIKYVYVTGIRGRTLNFIFWGEVGSEYNNCIRPVLGFYGRGKKNYSFILLVSVKFVNDI